MIVIKKCIPIVALVALSFSCSDGSDPSQAPPASANTAANTAAPSSSVPGPGGAGGMASGAGLGGGATVGAGGMPAGGVTATGGTSSGGTSAEVAGGAGAPSSVGGAAITGGAGGDVGAAGAATVPVAAGDLIGWATQGTGTTGGGELTPVVVTTFEELSAAAAGAEAKVIHVSGKLTGSLTIGSNKTIVGLAGAEISGDPGAIRLTDSSNVIIKNLRLVGRHTNPNVLLHNAKNVWIDHNEIVDGKSDVLRLTGTSDFVTISWNIFRQSKFGFEHMGVNIGDKDSSVESKGYLNVTLHHNIYQELINERMPRARFGKVHTFNNICLAGTEDKTRSYYAVRAGVDANVRSERNVYKDFKGASWWWIAEELGNENSTAFNFTRDNENSVLESIEDVCDNCELGPVDIKEHEGFTGKGGFYSSGTAFVPPYQYVADPTDGLEARVRAGAGPQQ